MITNRDMARFAEIATAGPGPIVIGRADFAAYQALRELGYVNEVGDMLYISVPGCAAARQWLGDIAKPPRQGQKARRILERI